jgi:FkbH-like protein
MKTFNELKKNLSKEFQNLRTIKIALLGDSATQLLGQTIKATGKDFGFNLDLWEADFNQIERQILDKSSDFYKFRPEFVIIFQSTHKLLLKYNKYKPEKYSDLSEERILQIEEIYQMLKDELNAKVIYFNYNEINDSVYGNFSNKLSHSFMFQIRKLNLELMKFAEKNSNFFICDLSSIQNTIGKERMFKPSIYVNTDMVLSLDSLPLISYNTLNIISAITGKIVKCVILDLDNTTWGGIIGDDGIENIQIGNLGLGKAFTEFQQWIKKLKNRGIIVCVCSKNNESNAKEPFEKHPEMVLRLEDISVFIANWETKVENIRQIQSILNIGFDSMIFLDDNPFERNIVKENIPEINVPDLPEDPADYLEFLYSRNFFETASVSNEDKDRTKSYQEEAKRTVFKKSFVNEDEFLISLNMQSQVEPINKFNTPRIAQLSQRSNQFNLRTIRYSDEDLTKISSKDNYYSLTFTLDDKFGSNGLICVIILEKKENGILFIESWFMSCRVLKRGMENFVLNNIVKLAKEIDANIIVGEFIPTQKNEMVKNHFENLGFSVYLENDQWYLETGKFIDRKTHINRNNE